MVSLTRLIERSHQLHEQTADFIGCESTSVGGTSGTMVGYAD